MTVFELIEECLKQDGYQEVNFRVRDDVFVSSSTRLRQCGGTYVRICPGSTLSQSLLSTLLCDSHAFDETSIVDKLGNQLRICGFRRGRFTVSFIDSACSLVISKSEDGCDPMPFQGGSIKEVVESCLRALPEQAE
ncbi:MAG: hypothetical protein BWY43_00023 [candidate division WS2 bacterium ADurb.Bin280]|uniref:Uncharacterized protein n=1 Tax=candidate division WS2 bacterium ADurb.Bin280 TaxID=1852829 RepID=A0A1V5SGK9_9BACT|nr:MAG: hypothetical protein BWY43_00023 [candidate division WS2 bacterium ADurb.Bin280]